MLTVRQSRIFKRDVRRCRRRNLVTSKLENVVKKLAKGEALGPKHKDHRLVGNWSNYRECHICPDWLLIYRIENGELHLIRTGTHNDLF